MTKYRDVIVAIPTALFVLAAVAYGGADRHVADGGDVTEAPLPGIGQRFDLRAAEGGAVTVVIHHSGRRDLYVLDDAGRAPAA